MELHYITSIDKYVTPEGDMYTDTELDVIDKMESDHKKTLATPTFIKLIAMFPDMKSAARRGLKSRIKFFKNYIKDINTNQENYYNNFIAKAHFQEQAYLKDISDKRFDKQRDECDKEIKSAMFKLSYLDELEGKAVKTSTMGIDENDIEKAKQVPIQNFYDGKLVVRGQRATGRCPFHSDNTASFTIYIEQNSYYCYGCHVGGSVVDYIMMQQNKDFLSAVKFLIR